MEQNRSLWFENALLPAGWAAGVRLRIEAGRIRDITANTPAAPDDECHKVALPGMPNVHSHAFQRGMAGLTETRGPANDNFWTWREVMYRFVSRIGQQECEAIAALAYMEMLEAGFTHVGEFHYFHRPATVNSTPQQMVDAICAAASTSGIGMTLLPCFYAHSDCGGKPPLEGQRPFVLTIDEFAQTVEHARHAIRSLAGANVGIAPHSLRAVAPEELAAILPLAQGGPIHIHAAEQTIEVDACVRWSGQRPVEWLLNNAPVDSRWCIVHATHMTPEETHALAHSGAVVGLCPVTEANLGDGIFPTPAFWQGGRIAVGTDSNVLIGVADELRTLEYIQRLFLRSRNILCRDEGSSNGGDLYRAALQGGAHALGLHHGLAQGASADIVTLNIDHPSMLGRSRDTWIDSFLFSAPRGAISTVWRAGRKVVADGHHVERAQITERYRKVMSRIA